MTLDEFIEEQTKKLAAFKEFWIESNKNEPEHFPMDNKEGDWDEQLVLFDGPNPGFTLIDQMNDMCEKLGITTIAFAWECDQCGTVNQDSDMICVKCGRKYEDVPND